MRQTRLILALGLLVLVAAVAVWFALGGGQVARIDAANESLTSSNTPDGDALQPAPISASDADHTVPARPKPVPPPEDPEDAEDADAFVLAGRIDPASNFPAPLHKWLKECDEVLIVYLADGEEPATAHMLVATLDETLKFRTTEPPGAFGLGTGEALPAGRWQVLCARDGNYGDSLADLDHATESKLKGLIKPRIQGRHIDFGVISLEADAFLGDAVVIKGRLLHTSGKPLRYAGGYYVYGDNEESVEDSESIYIEGEIYTAGDGSFFAGAYVDGALPADLSGFQFRLHDVFSESDFGDAYPLSAPVREGRVLDFGDITLTGALLEVILKGPLNPDGVAPFDTVDDYEGDSVYLELENGSDYAEATALPQPFTSTVLLPEGRFFWTAWVNADGHYPDHDGILMARIGEVYSLEIDVEPYATIPLEITADSTPTGDVVVGWSILRDDELVDEGSFHYVTSGTIPVLAETVTAVSVQAFGFERAVGEGRTDMKKLVIPLVPDTSPRATLTVTVPAFPEAMDPRLGTSGLRLQGLDANGPQLARHVDWKREAQEFTFDVRSFGRYALVLDGAQAYGFPAGVIYKLEEFHLTAGEDRRIEIPALPAPPWATGVRTTRVTALAGGRPMSLEAWLAYEEVETPWYINVRDGGELRVQGRPSAIKDSFGAYPVEFILPDTGDVAQLRIEFPHTIEVRLTRNGQPVADFEATASSVLDEPGGFGLECRAGTRDGMAQLWFPRGKARIEVEALGWEVYSQVHEIAPGEVLRIDAKSDLALLTVEFDGEPRNVVYKDSDIPALWRVEALNEEGVWQERNGIRTPDVLTLNPALYRLVPWNGGAADAIEADLRNGDRTITLPALPAWELGSVTLKFDVTSFGTKWVSADFQYQITKRLTPDTQEEAWGFWCSTKVVPDGFKIEGLPMHAELAIWGNIWCEDDDGDVYLFVKPVRVTIKEGGRLVDATMLAGLEVHDEWYDISARLVTGVEGLMVPIDGYLPVGRNEFAFYDYAGKFLLKDWATITAQTESGARIPAHIRARLEALGAMQPDEEE